MLDGESRRDMSIVLIGTASIGAVVVCLHGSGSFTKRAAALGILHQTSNQKHCGY